MAVLKVNKTYPSLNDYTDTGPTLTAGILGILLQFRRHKEGLVADMQKAFLNIGIYEKQGLDAFCIAG